MNGEYGNNVLKPHASHTSHPSVNHIGERLSNRVLGTDTETPYGPSLLLCLVTCSILKTRSFDVSPQNRCMPFN